MTLEEWATIPWEQQRELIIQWYRADPCLWFEYEELALKAAGILTEHLKAVPEVELVELGGGEIITIQEPWNHVMQLVLNVCTLLPESQHLAQVPPQLLGFPVRQVNLGDKRNAYLKTWKRLFKELKGWDESQTLRWAERWTESLKSARSPLYSRGPVTTAVPSLIDKEVSQSVGDRLSGLHSELRDIICRNRFEDRSVALSRALFLHPDAVEDYDWEYARQKIKELIQKYRS